jgi:hypothetical protein
MLRRSRHADNGNLWAEPPPRTNFAKLLPIYHKAHRAKPMTQLRTPHLFIVCDRADRALN